eukprot:TRINITY_DN4654_c1_g1_i1.p1 TRINITY_DN4654_c1_g1~~TRINITY_DN4654_c1_g1_i1.p1  ORF type:complete len:216 (-),score=35.19 TRINITY_DN4654_c1_g1_i1:176-745(-)
MATRVLILSACLVLGAGQLSPSPGVITDAATGVGSGNGTVAVTEQPGPLKCRAENEKLLKEGFATKGKLTMMILQMFNLGIFGVDRCYMGNTCAGVIKGLTCGGCGIWALIDLIIILINCLDKSCYISKLGYEAVWSDENMDTPYYLAIVSVILLLFQSCSAAHRANQSQKSNARSESSSEELSEEDDE